MDDSFGLNHRVLHDDGKTWCAVADDNASCLPASVERVSPLPRQPPFPPAPSTPLRPPHLEQYGPTARARQELVISAAATPRRGDPGTSIQQIADWASSHPGELLTPMDDISNLLQDDDPIDVDAAERWLSALDPWQAPLICSPRIATPAAWPLRPGLVALGLSDKLAMRIVQYTQMNSARPFLRTLNVLGSATKRWRTVVKNAMIQDNSTVLRVSGPSQAEQCLKTGVFAGLRRLRVAMKPQHGDPNLHLLARALQGSSVAFLNLSGNEQMSELSGISVLVQLVSLEANDTLVSDVKGLSHLTNLVLLNLTNSAVKSLVGLSPLISLQALCLAGTNVGSLHGVQRLRNLQTLYLGGTPVDDLTMVSGLVSLRILYLNATKVASISPLSSLFHKLRMRDLIL